MNIAHIEDKLVVISETTGAMVYDFDFDLHFRCTHPHRFVNREWCVLRIGPILDYEYEFRKAADWDIRLINSPAEHLRASELEAWYPTLADLTPRSKVFANLPPVDEIKACFTWPIFLKGSRQTSKHSLDLSVITNAEHYQRAVAIYQSDPILHWQRPVVREFVPLVPVAGHVPGKINPSLEFRSFWWHGQCVGWGEYWYQVPHYEAPDIHLGLSVAEEAAKRLQVPFLVVDFGKTIDGRWIVIECNDAQEAGYSAIHPQSLWRRVLDCVDGKVQVND
jgi:hypothetical protein